MARSVDDLELELGVLAGPDRWNSPAWRLDLPPSTAGELADFRIAGMARRPVVPGRRRHVARHGLARRAIEAAGGRVDVDARPSFSLEYVSSVYLPLLFAALGQRVPARGARSHGCKHRRHRVGRGRCAARRCAIRTGSATTSADSSCASRSPSSSTDFDAILMPVHPRAAIPHDQSGTPATRMVAIDGVDRSYMELFRWIALAGVAYLPSTVVPVGTSDDGLPIGVQIVGPYLHDRTTLHLAKHIEALVRATRRRPLRPSLAIDPRTHSPSFHVCDKKSETRFSNFLSQTSISRSARPLGEALQVGERLLEALRRRASTSARVPCPSPAWPGDPADRSTRQPLSVASIRTDSAIVSRIGIFDFTTANAKCCSSSQAVNCSSSGSFFTVTRRPPPTPLAAPSTSTASSVVNHFGQPTWSAINPQTTGGGAGCRRCARHGSAPSRSTRVAARDGSASGAPSESDVCDKNLMTGSQISCRKRGLTGAMAGAGFRGTAWWR